MQSPPNRIRRVAFVIRWCATLACGAILALSGAILVTHSGNFAWTPEISWLSISARVAPSATIPPGDLGELLALASPLVLAWGLFRLARMMRGCERGDLFTSRVAMDLQAFSASVMVAELLDFTVPPLVTAVNAARGRYTAEISLVISGEQLWSLLLALIFLVLAWMLREAVAIREDNASIV